MTGGVKYLLAQLSAKPAIYNCVECGVSLDGRRRDTVCCSDKCRKLKNGQTRRR